MLLKHREAQLPSPVPGNRGYHRLTQCLARVLGRPHQPKMGLTRDMVVQLLRLPPRDLVSFRNHLAACTLTAGCMRPGEGALAQSCDLCFNSVYNLRLLQTRAAPL